MNLEGYVCKHCNGRVNPRTMKCEYCDTQYKREYEDILPPFRVEHYMNPTQRYGARVTIPNEYIKGMGAHDATEYAIREMAHQLAECIIPCMQVESRYDIDRCGWDIRSTIEVVQPKHGFRSAFELADMMR